jgi:hypothetical protein
MLMLLRPVNATANPVISPLGTIGDLIIFSLLSFYIVLIEGTAIKLLLFAPDEISWPGAVAVAVVVNLISAAAGYLVGVYYDLNLFEFEPNLPMVFGLSLLAEGVFLYFVHSRRRLVRSAITVAAMNVASYLVLLLAQFPDSI